MLNDWLSVGHFLRPLWFLAMLPLVVLLWLWLRAEQRGGSWQRVIDAPLLSHLLLQTGARQSRWPMVLAVFIALLAITALAGPAWTQLPQPVFRAQSALVIVLDLSRSMDATDIKPSRLTRARHKVLDILERRQEGQTALIVYAGTPFTVSPLTDDNATVSAQLKAMATQLMPSQGSRADLALLQAETLLNQAAASKAQVLLVTDGLAEELFDSNRLDKAVAHLSERGHRLSVLAVGTAAGAPIPLADGRFLKDAQGRVVIPRLAAEQLRALAERGQGHYQHLTVDDSDIDTLLATMTINPDDNKEAEEELQTDRWQEEGPWLLLLLLPLSALVFRRGWLTVIVLVLLLPIPSPGWAVTWADLWSTADQRGAKTLSQGDAAQAAQQFEDPHWRAAAHYRAGDYEAAAAILADLDDADAHYNRGNALAQAGRLPDALAAYQKALAKDPDHEDARHNQNWVKQQQKQQDDKQQDGEQGKEQKGEQGEGKSENEQGSEQENTAATEGEQRDTENAAETEQNTSDSAGQENAQALADNSPDTEQSKDQSKDQPEDPSQSDSEQTATEADRQTAEADESNQASKPSLSNSNELSESEQANEQWLRRIPDDPGGLWKRKFQQQYSRRSRGEESSQPW